MFCYLANYKKGTFGAKAEFSAKLEKPKFKTNENAYTIGSVVLK
jgi:hypothetical protein